MRRAWTGRDHDALRPHRFRLGYRNLIVAANLDLRSQFAEILDQVIGKRIVVIEYEDQASSPSSNRLSPEFEAFLADARPTSRRNVHPGAEDELPQMGSLLPDGGIDRLVLLH